MILKALETERTNTTPKNPLTNIWTPEAEEALGCSGCVAISLEEMLAPWTSPVVNANWTNKLTLTALHWWTSKLYFFKKVINLNWHLTSHVSTQKSDHKCQFLLYLFWLPSRPMLEGSAFPVPLHPWVLSPPLVVNPPLFRQGYIFFLHWTFIPSHAMGYHGAEKLKNEKMKQIN